MIKSTKTNLNKFIKYFKIIRLFLYKIRQGYNKYYIFGKEGAKGLAEQMNIDLLAEIPLVQSVREASDIGRPAVLQGSTDVAIALSNLAKKVIEKTL